MAQLAVPRYGREHLWRLAVAVGRRQNGAVAGLGWKWWEKCLEHMEKNMEKHGKIWNTYGKLWRNLRKSEHDGSSLVETDGNILWVFWRKKN